MPSKQPTKLSEKRRIYVFYWNIQDGEELPPYTDEGQAENYVITSDREQAIEWARGGGRVVEYARGSFMKG